MSAREMFEVREIHTKARLSQNQWETALDEAQAIVLRAHLNANPVAQPTLQLGMEILKAEEVLEQLDEKMEHGEAQPVVDVSVLPPNTEIVHMTHSRRERYINVLVLGHGASEEGSRMQETPSVPLYGGGVRVQ